MHAEPLVICGGIVIVGPSPIDFDLDPTVTPMYPTSTSGRISQW
eukprot:SAG11_NODE_847_length_6882_cov_3.352204_11_plen_44_part_00